MLGRNEKILPWSKILKTQLLNHPDYHKYCVERHPLPINIVFIFTFLILEYICFLSLLHVFLHCLLFDFF